MSTAKLLLHHCCIHLQQQPTSAGEHCTLANLCNPCRVMGRGFLPRKCVYGTRPVSAHPLGAIQCLMLANYSACWLTGLGLGTPSRYMVKKISWNACKLLVLSLLLSLFIIIMIIIVKSLQCTSKLGAIDRHINAVSNRHMSLGHTMCTSTQHMLLYECFAIQMHIMLT